MADELFGLQSAIVLVGSAVLKHQRVTLLLYIRPLRTGAVLLHDRTIHLHPVVTEVHGFLPHLLVFPLNKGTVLGSKNAVI